MRTQNKKNEDVKVQNDEKNLIDFFALLLKVDKRVNPHLYQKGLLNENVSLKSNYGEVRKIQSL